MHGLQVIDIQDSQGMAHPSSASRFLSPLPHGGLFISAFVVAHLAVLGAACAAAVLQGPADELASVSRPDARAVHHLGQMRLVPLHALTQGAQ